MEINIVLSRDDEVAAYNSAYRGKDAATNILSFATGDALLLGDMILAYDTLLREAGEQGKTFEAHYVHLVVHGTLHLLGFDHIRPRDAKVMEALEVAVLGRLGYGNPY